jgi:hypothetical protein
MFLPSRRKSIAVAGLGLVLAALLIWAWRSEPESSRRVNQKLEELRAAGEPIDAELLAKMFPGTPSEFDASRLTNALFTFVRTNRAPGLTPIIMSGPGLARTQSIGAHVMAVLQRHYEASANITEVLPLLPAGARFGTDWSNGVVNAPMVSFVDVRHTIQMLTTRALYAAEVGDSEGATAMLERSFRFGNAVSRDATLVEHMIRDACIGLACTMTERALNRAELSDGQLARILASLPRPATNDLLAVFRVEHCMAIWAFNEVRAGRRMDDLFGRSIADSWWERIWERYRPRFNQYNDEDFLAFLEMIPQRIEAVALPPRAAVAEFDRVYSKYKSNATSEVGQGVNPNWPKALPAHYECEAKLEVVRAALAVERFRRANGRLPASVVDLSPRFLESVPMDTLQGGPLRLKALARGYVVYSVGWDGMDDGGLEKTNSAVQTQYDIAVTVER